LQVFGWIGILGDLLARRSGLTVGESNCGRREVLEEGILRADDERACGEGALGFDHLRQRFRQRLRHLRACPPHGDEQRNGDRGWTHAKSLPPT